ncbi:hypothetical protein [Roseibium sp. RKSG952]|uniref:hypothetical protein n=1 Tax=Roseibium sp. RKSG952 TaxID=2529384 RepID=UPI0012BC45DD|nr:hypothetical protein [Roseibium sp. RKSG952]MTH94969.1 hypothetical protein [Roseibium sp. RKSG952]
MKLSDEIGTLAVADLLLPLTNQGHVVEDANNIRMNQPGYDFIVDRSFRIQVKTGTYVESFGWAHKVGGSGADLEFDFLIGVDLGVLLNGNLGRLATKNIPIKDTPDFYLIPGDVVRSWVKQERRVNKRGNHIYYYKRKLNQNTKEAQTQTLELFDYLNNFDLLEKTIRRVLPNC